MTDYKKRLGTAVATVAIMANAFAPVTAFAGTTITISGNAADSQNDAVVNNTHNTNVTQSNTANFTNNVDGDADTGDNDANRNNGGDVSIKTGKASVNATVSNSANQNWANVDCCDQGDTEVKISGNADNSNNTANLDVDNNVKVNQTNNAYFDNDLRYLNADTGNNDARRNNGGDVSIDTGDASVKVAVSNWANGNSAMVGGHDSEGANVSLKIIGNAADSTNDIVVDLNGTTNVTQNNTANFTNDVDGDADTGDNDANRNNGGEVEITTGDASVDVTVDNMANFNWADLNCGCLLGDLDVTVEGNADSSENTVNGDFDSNQTSNQTNGADFDNNVENLDADTGNNDANRNNGEVGEDSDPSIDTGDADVDANVSNSANLNGLGGEEPEWPDFDLGGLHISLSFDLGDLMDALGL